MSEPLLSNSIALTLIALRMVSSTKILFFFIKDRPSSCMIMIITKTKYEEM